MKKANGVLAVVAMGFLLGAGCGASKSDAGGGAEAVTPISHDLDGRSYAIVLTEEGKAGDKDDLIFAKGTFDSVGCRHYGFTLAPYKTENAGDAVEFEATANSPKEGTNVWKGTITGDTIKGTMVWTKGGKSVNHTFSGKVK